LKKDKAERKAARRDAREAVPAAHRDLFEKLRAKRLELAKAQNVPPYVIFHDKTLAEMAARNPRSVHELAGIPGVGDVKLTRFGQAFLDVIKAHDLSPTENVRPDV
jgi:ATP-dependent DNA helicase RecQ